MEGRKAWFCRFWALALLGAVLYGTTDAKAASPQGVLKEAIHWGLSADWLDPSTASCVTTANHPLYLFHDALLRAMPEGTYTPCLAESWNISPDFKVYEFKLRKGVKFHNGDIMTAEDVVFSFWRYKAALAKFFIFSRAQPPSAGWFQKNILKKSETQDLKGTR